MSGDLSNHQDPSVPQDSSDSSNPDADDAQSRETTAEAEPSPSPISRRVIRNTLLVLAVIGVSAVGARYYWNTAPLRDLPTLDLSDVYPDIAEAVRTARRNVEDEPRSSEAWGHLAMVLRAHDLEAEADQCFKVAERLDPDEFLWPYLQGLSQETLDTNAALDCYRRAVRIRPRYALARLPLAELLISMQQFEEADKHLQTAIRLEPGNPRTMLALGRLSFMRGDLPQALNWVQQSAERAPGRRMTHDLLAQILHRLGEHEEATQNLALVRHLPLDEGVEDPHLEMVVKLRRDPHWVHTNAVQLVYKGQVDRGIVALRSAVESAPQIPYLHQELARALATARRTREALQVIDRGIERHPESSDLRHFAGQLHAARKEWTQASERFSQAIEYRPDGAKSWLELGNCRLALEDNDGALAAWQKAVKFQPQMTAAHIQLASCYLRAGDKHMAGTHLQTARQLDPDSDQVRTLIKQLPAD